MAKIRNYYAAGNTAQGFCNLFESNLHGLDRIYILKGGPGTGKSTLMKKIGELGFAKGYDIEYIHCASDNASIDGVIFPQLKTGIVDGTAPHVIEPKTPGAVEQYVNLGEAWDADLLARHRGEIEALNERIGDAYAQAYATLAAALRVHDDWEQVYIRHIDREKAEQLAQSLIKTVFGERKTDKTALVRRRFLGAATPQGAVDFIPNLTEDMTKRYFIKGRPGSGKSTLLKKMAQEAEQRGLDVEMYHCGFDPQSLDMVIVPELQVALFDSTAPHEYFPERAGDETIDLYEQTIARGTDEAYAEELNDFRTRYTALMKEAIGCLAEAKRLRDQLEHIYQPAMDFRKIDEIRSRMETEIFSSGG